MIIVYINCRIIPFILYIMQGLKLFETRNKNTLRQLVGKRVYFAETGKGKAIVKCSAVIESALVITSRKQWNLYRHNTMVPEGSAYDWTNKTRRKYLYKLSNVQPVKAPFFVPEGVRHGRVWIECNNKNND